MKTEIRLVESEAYGWRVLYDAGATHPVSAHFTIQVRTKDNDVVCTYRSPTAYAYSPNTRTRVWRWDAWAEVGRPAACDAPVPPTRVCIRYDGHGKYGTPFDTPFTCTAYPPDSEDTAP